MAIARISGQGLAAIAVLVGLLWACLLAERVTVRRARAEEARTWQALRKLRTRRAAVPLRRGPDRHRPSRLTL